MKHKLSVLLVVLVSTVSCFAQSAEIDLPGSTLIPHYRLAIGYNSTTILVFPAVVRPIDRGDRDILAMKQPGVDNVLKIKASRRNFMPTNLHVFTGDGRIYAFNVTYTDSMASSHDLTQLMPIKGSPHPTPIVSFTDQWMNDEQLHRIVAMLHDSAHYHSIITVRHADMRLSIEQIGQRGPLLFIRLRLHNRSNLRYQLDFLRCYVRDRRKARRTSIQEQELTPVYQDTIPVLAGHTGETMVIALPVFTLANGKEGIIEAYERNGGRSLVLHLHNRTLLHARLL